MSGLQAGRELLGRYRLERPIGQGSAGEVWEARDLRGGARVALKWLPLSQARALRRREVQALRWLRLPGVVELLDEGDEADGTALIMERVEGRPFPGALPLPGWAGLRPRLGALLRVLAGVHAAGLCCGDLKPEHALVRPDGRLTLIDLGLAVGPALPQGWAFAGSPRYASPEQCQGAPASPASDLYAVGVMAMEALCGLWPQAGAAPAQLLSRRAREPAPELARLAPGLEEEARALIQGLLEPDPQRRAGPADALADALGQGLSLPQPPGPGPWERRQLRALVEPEPFGAADLAGLLHQGSGGEAGALRRLISSGMQAGWLVQGRGGRLRAEPGALGRLRAGPALLRALHHPGPAAALWALVREELDLPGLPLAERQAALELALEGARAEPALEAEVLVRLLRLALSTESPRALERASRALGPVRPELEPCWTLLAGARAALRGEVDRALGLLGQPLPAPADDEELEQWRVGLCLRALARRGAAAEEQALEQLTGWARSPARQARLAAWTGNLRYRQGRYAEAARLHAAALALRPEGPPRLAALGNLAAALLELPDLPAAARSAAAAARLARRLDQPLLCAQALWTLRCARYRQGQALRPELPGLRAARALGPLIGGLWGLTEAGCAWRRGSRRSAARLARQAAADLQQAGLPEAALLAQALALQDPQERGAEALIALGAAAPPELGLQALALLAQARPALRPAAAQAAQPLWAQLSPGREALCLDLLSPAQARRLLSEPT